MPGYDALNDLLGAIDPTAYVRALTAFLQAHAGLLPRSLALDGKSVGNGRCGLIVTLCRHEDGRPVAMTVARGKKEDCEVSEGRALLADPQVELAHALVTADPLHNKADTERRNSPSKVSETILPVASTDAWPDTKIRSPTTTAGLNGSVEVGVSGPLG